MSIVKNIARGPQDLADGRVLAPEEVAENVELTDHERGKVAAGQLLVIHGEGHDQTANVSEPQPRRSRAKKED